MDWTQWDQQIAEQPPVIPKPPPKAPSVPQQGFMGTHPVVKGPVGQSVPSSVPIPGASTSSTQPILLSDGEIDDAWKKGGLGAVWERNARGSKESEFFTISGAGERRAAYTRANRAILHRLINNPKISDAELKAFFESKKIKPTSRWFGETTSALLHAKRSKEFAGYGLKGISSQIPSGTEAATTAKKVKGFSQKALDQLKKLQQ